MLIFSVLSAIGSSDETSEDVSGFINFYLSVSVIHPLSIKLESNTLDSGYSFIN